MRRTGAWWSWYFWRGSIRKKNESSCPLFFSSCRAESYDKTAATASSLSEGQVDIGKSSIKQVVNKPSTCLLNITTNKHWDGEHVIRAQRSARSRILGIPRPLRSLGGLGTWLGEQASESVGAYLDRVRSGLGITTSIFTEEPPKRIDGTITWARRKGAATRKADGKGRAYQTTKKCHPDGLSARACSLAIRPRLCALVFHLTSISF